MSETKEEIVIGTRGSALALFQARRVQSLLRANGNNASIAIIQTTGDRVQDRFLFEIGGKGLFIKEIEAQLLDGRVDIGVHSLKDLPAKLGRDFCLAAYLKRDSPCDIFVQNPRKPALFDNSDALLGESDFADKKDLIIATGSLRRRALFESLSSSHQMVGIRGNVDTRMLKLQKSEWDGLVLAQASLERLKMAERRHSRALDPSWFVPSPGQGVVAVECLQDSPVRELITQLMDDPVSRAMSELERGVLADLGGDCRMPIGAFASIEEGQSWVFHGLVLAPGLEPVRVLHRGSGFDQESIGEARRVIYKMFFHADVNKAFAALGIHAISQSYPGA